VEDGSILTKILEVEVMDRKGKKKIIAQWVPYSGT
jgi:hypothetical protein